MHKWQKELRIEKNGGGMSWETCRKADYLDDDYEYKNKNSEVFSYLTKVKGDFRAWSHTISYNKGILNTSLLLS